MRELRSPMIKLDIMACFDRFPFSTLEILALGISLEDIQVYERQKQIPTNLI